MQKANGYMQIVLIANFKSRSIIRKNMRITCTSHIFEFR